MQMENIASFLSAATTLGVRASDSFQVVDLFEAKNPFQVVLAIIALKFSISGHVPRTHHLTWLDEYMIVGFSMVMLSGIETLVNTLKVGRRHREGRTEVGPKNVGREERNNT